MLNEMQGNVEGLRLKNTMEEEEEGGGGGGGRGGGGGVEGSGKGRKGAF